MDNGNSHRKETAAVSLDIAQHLSLIDVFEDKELGTFNAQTGRLHSTHPEQPFCHLHLLKKLLLWNFYLWRNEERNESLKVTRKGKVKISWFAYHCILPDTTAVFSNLLHNPLSHIQMSLIHSKSNTLSAFASYLPAMIFDMSQNSDKIHSAKIHWPEDDMFWILTMSPCYYGTMK